MTTIFYKTKLFLKRFSCEHNFSYKNFDGNYYIHVCDKCHKVLLAPHKRVVFENKKSHFNKVMDFSLPFLIVSLLLSLFLSFYAHSQVRYDIKDILKDKRTSTQECLVMTLYHEARSESNYANIMILNTVYNRVYSKDYPSTPCKVIKQNKQYSFTHDGKSDIMQNKFQVKRLNNLVDKYLLNKKLFLSLSEGVNHYHSLDVQPYWIKSKRMQYVGTYDHHIFYKRRSNY